MAAVDTAQGAQQPLDLMVYVSFLLTVLSRYYKWILGLNVVGVVLVTAYIQSLVPSYTATVTLHIAPKDNTVFNLERLYWGDSDTSFKETQIGLLQSNKLLRVVVEKLDLHLVPELSPSTIRVGPVGFVEHLLKGPDVDKGSLDETVAIQSTASELQGLIDIVQADDYGYSNLFYVRVSLAQPKLAAETANALAESYIELVFDNEMSTALKNQAFLSDRLNVLNAELKDAEQRLRDFMEAEDIVSTNSQSDEVDSELSTVSNRYFKAQQDRIHLENLVQQVKQFRGGGLELGNVSAIASNPMVSRINNQIIDLEQRKSELSRRYGKRHNTMISLESELETARSNLQRQITNVLDSISSDLAVARRAEESARATLEEVRDRKQSRGRKDFELTQLQQDIAVKRDVYTVFLEKLNQDNAAGPVRNTNLWIADPATVPRRGTKISLVTAILATLMACSVVGFALGGLLVFMDNSLETEAEVLDKTGVPLLGMLPIVAEAEGARSEGNSQFTEYLENLHSRFSEAIRSVRTSLTLLGVGRAHQKILISSCQTHEGKTSVALTLSASYAQTSRVLLIDADLRRPSIERALNKTSHHNLGLSDLISGGATFDECVVHNDDADFDVLFAGSRSLRPLELLGSAGFTTLLNEVAERYDRVIIDSPPCSAVSDAYLLGSMADYVVFVVKASFTSVANIRSVLARFHELDVSVAGILLNQVDFSSKKHPYYHDYSYEAYGAESAKKVGLKESKGV
jgi:succinoglycan biosynthesis transport protein ExoP